MDQSDHSAETGESLCATYTNSSTNTLTHTETHTHTHRHTHTHTHKPTVTLTHIQTRTLTHTPTQTDTNISVSHSLTHSLPNPKKLRHTSGDSPSVRFTCSDTSPTANSMVWKIVHFHLLIIHLCHRRMSVFQDEYNPSQCSGRKNHWKSGNASGAILGQWNTQKLFSSPIFLWHSA